PYTSPPEGKWSTGLCGCFENLSNCWVTCCCPLITFGHIAEIVDQGRTFKSSSSWSNFIYIYMLLFLRSSKLYDACPCCACLYACTYQAKLRGLYFLPPESCGDCCVHHFCFCCALCQKYRELKNRGLDPSLGWVTCWCPYITFGRTAEIVDQGRTSCFTATRNCLMLAHLFGIGACIYTCTYRAKLRGHYSLPPKPCGDCCVHFCCFFCALCQEYRELKIRGLDPEGGT
ncbi:hypothetical protein ACB092_03G001400, partial [Castanea dentata]